MTNAEVQQLLHSAPFVPFTIHLANGSSFKIDHPDFATLSRAGQVLAVNTQGNAFALIDLLLATHLETHPAESPTAESLQR